MKTYKTRLKIAWKLRELLPWASVIAGAPRHPFIEVWRPETIVGSTSNSAWSRSIPGSRYLHVEHDEIECCENLAPGPGQHSRWKVTKTIGGVVYGGPKTIDAFAKVIADVATMFVVPMTNEQIEADMRPNERVEQRVHDLDIVP